MIKTIVFFILFILCIFYLNADSNEDFINAAKGGNLEKVKSLLTFGVDINYKSKNDIVMGAAEGKTALIFSALKGHLDIVKYLLEAGADPNVKDVIGETAIFHAIRSCTSMTYVEIIRLLIIYKAELNIINNWGETPLILACRTNYDLSIVVDLFISTGIKNIDQADRQNKTALLYAKEYRNQKVVDILLKAGAEDKPYFSQQQLYDNYLDTLKPVDRSLINAVRFGSFPAMTGSINSGANVNIKDFNDMTPLMIAVQNDFYNMVLYLLQNGANVNINTKDNLSALMIAATNGNVKIVQLLIAYKADINLRQTSLGLNAYDMAKFNNHTDVMLILQQAGNR